MPAAAVTRPKWRFEPCFRPLGWLAVASLLLGGVQGSAAALPTRLVIDMVLVSSGDAALDQALRQWSNLIRTRLPNLLQDPSLQLSRGGRIQVRENTNRVTIAPNPAVMATRWQQNHAIQVVAALSSRSGSQIVVDGSIYFGGLKGALPYPRLTIRQTVSVSQYREGADIVSLATLYALAMDAGAPNKAAACEILQRARTIGTGIRAAAGAAELKAAVAKSLLEFNCRAGR